MLFDARQHTCTTAAACAWSSWSGTGITVPSGATVGTGGGGICASTSGSVTGTGTGALAAPGGAASRCSAALAAVRGTKYCAAALDWRMMRSGGSPTVLTMRATCGEEQRTRESGVSE